MISSLPAEAEDRAVSGDWEGDLIIGLNRSAIGTLLERSSRFKMLAHLPRGGWTDATNHELTGIGRLWRRHDGKRAHEDHDGAAGTALPIAHLRLWQLSDHARFTIEPGVSVVFADPHRTLQRGTNESTNGRLRQNFPDGTEPFRWSGRGIQAVANAVNTRPRMTPGWKTPAEALNEHLLSV